MNNQLYSSPRNANSSSDFLYRLYRWDVNKWRWLIRRWISLREGGQLYSLTLRKIYKTYHDVEIGLYSYGGCFSPCYIDRFTKFGRYCSIAARLKVFNLNHPDQFKSTHPFFYHKKFKFCDHDLADYIPLKVGNDVWIGSDTIIVPRVMEIGDGAVIGAGSVVTKNVPPYAIVAGNPARIIRYRFSPERIQELLESRWWDQDITEIQNHIDEYLKPYPPMEEKKT